MRKATVSSLLVVFLFTFAASPSPSQSGNSREAVRAQMIELVRYVELEEKTTPADVDRLVELWSKAGQLRISKEEREAAFRELYILYAKLHGADFTGRPQALSALARRAAASFEAGARMDLRLPEPRRSVSGDYIHVETHGRGSLQMVLISSAGSDGRELYRSMVERSKDNYTMHIVTLPGAGLARSLPWPEVYDLTRRPWLNNIEGSLLRLLEKHKGNLTIIGTAAGGYFAARLAILKPEKIRAAVLVDALVNIAMPSPTSSDRPASLQERLAAMKRFVPPQLFPMGEVPSSREQIRKLLDDPKNSHPAVRNWMAFAVKDEALSKKWTLDALANGFFSRGLRYSFELQTTDLAEDFKGLSVPTLVMCALHDEKSPRAGVSSSAQWEQVKRLYPHIPLTIATFTNTRSFISEDNPTEFDRVLRDFLARKPVED